MHGYHTRLSPEHRDLRRDPVQARKLSNQRRLMFSALDYIYAHPKLASLGPDPLVSHLVAAKGLTDQHVAVVRLVASGQLVTALCVPTRAYRDPYLRKALKEVKAEALEDRTRCIIVPQRWLRGTVRGAVARLLSASRHVGYDNRQLRSVLNHIQVTRITTLAACAAAVPDHRDPYGAVFSMCCAGLIDIDRSRPVTDSTWLSSILR